MTENTPRPQSERSLLDRLLTLATVLLFLLFGVSAFYHWWWRPRHPEPLRTVEPLLALEEEKGAEAAYVQALELLQQGKAGDSERYFLIDLGLRLGRIEQVRPVVEAWLEAPEPSAPALLAAFRFYLLTGEIEPAVSSARRLLRVDPAAQATPQVFGLYEELVRRLLAENQLPELDGLVNPDAALRSPIMTLGYLRGPAAGSAATEQLAILLAEAESTMDPWTRHAVRAALQASAEGADAGQADFLEALALAVTDADSVRFWRLNILAYFLQKDRWVTSGMKELYARPDHAGFSPGSYLAYLQMLRTKGETRTMLKVAREFGERHPTESSGRYLKVYLELLLGENVAAHDQMLSAMPGLAGEGWEIRSVSALAALRQGDPNRALATLEGLPEAQDRLGDLPRVLYAAALARAGRFDEASAMLAGIELAQLLPEERALVDGVTPAVPAE